MMRDAVSCMAFRVWIGCTLYKDTLCVVVIGGDGGLPWIKEGWTGLGEYSSDTD